MSIMPLLMAAPQNTPTEATMIIVRNVAARLPMAELRKLTASLLTPTERSNTARMKRKTMMQRNNISICCSLPFFTLQKSGNIIS